MEYRYYKYRIYPNENQQTLIDNTFNNVRYIYNYFLGLKICAYKKNKTTYSYKETSSILTLMKKEKEWLKESDKCALQNALKDLDSSFVYFYRGVNRFPNFKTKKKSKKSYRTNCNLKIEPKRIRIPKIGWLKTREKRIPEGKIIYITITKSKAGKYYASVCFSIENSSFIPKTNKKIGIDMGVKDFCVTSNGERFLNFADKKSFDRRIAFLRKSLSRKTRGSNRYEKALRRLQKEYEYQANVRKDYIHKLSTALIKNYDYIAVEGVNVKELTQKGVASKSIIWEAWGMFFEFLNYKAKWYGKTVVEADRFFPSSQKCSNCGAINTNLRNLKVREWNCPICGAKHDRDVNAAINVLNECLSRTVGTTGIAQENFFEKMTENFL